MVKKLLIIDDSAEYLEMLNMALRKDYKVQTVSDFNDLKEITDLEQFDALLIDFHIGLYTAYDVIELLKSKDQKAFDQIPSILLTGSVDIEKETTNLSVTASLEKPFKIAQLKELLTQVLSDS